MAKSKLPLCSSSIDSKITMEAKSDFHSKHDRESLFHVRDDYGDMKNLIGQLSSKLTTVSSHIEKEFLSAYRVHMLSVQEELRSLKSQVVDAEVALNDDEEVSKLENEVTWFSDEATRLRNQSNSMKKDMQHVVARIDALREQRQYLNEQLKTTMKRSKILEAEMGILQEQSQMYEGNIGMDSQEAYEESYGYMGNQQDGLNRHDSSNNLRRQNSDNTLSSKKGRGGHSVSSLPSIGKKPKRVPPTDALITKKIGTKDLMNVKQSAVEELQQLMDSR